MQNTICFANVGCSPTPRQHFKKTAAPKNFQLPAAYCLETMFLGKPIFSIRQKGVPPLLLPARMLQLPRCLVRICNLFHKDNQAENWQVSKHAIAAGRTDCKIVCFANVGCSPTPQQHFKKTAAPKNFQLPAARFLQPACKQACFSGNHTFHKF